MNITFISHYFMINIVWSHMGRGREGERERERENILDMIEIMNRMTF